MSINLITYAHPRRTSMMQLLIIVLKIIGRTRITMILYDIFRILMQDSIVNYPFCSDVRHDSSKFYKVYYVTQSLNCLDQNHMIFW